MQKASSFLCVFLALILTATACADGNDVLAQLQKNEGYSLQVEGRDEDGEFTATYLYTPEVQVYSRKDRTGESTYLYDKVKRPEKVMVTRAGVAYMYRLDNPNLPAYFPGSLLEYYLKRESDVRFQYGPDGQVKTLEVGDYSEEGTGFLVTEVEFEPDPEDPRFRRYAHFLRQ